jgi:hypothetical protein
VSRSAQWTVFTQHLTCAIRSADDVPTEQQRFVALNRQLSRRWPVITKVGGRPPDADQWQDVPGKARFLGNDGTGHGR